MKQPSIRNIIHTAALSILVASFAGLGASQVPNAIGATPQPDGEKIFKDSCVVCHAAGGNIINSKKPVKGSDKLATAKAFQAYLLKPTGSMTAFPQIANDAPSLQALYAYCKKFNKKAKQAE